MSQASCQSTGLSTLRRMAAAGERFAMLTCYDATTARWLARGGVRVLLVGDTASEMILGHDTTIHAPLSLMVLLTAAVKRGAPDCFVMADMPFMSYQVEEAAAIENAGRFLTEGRADAVKLEVDQSFCDLVARMSRAGVPVVAHLGSRPQHVRRQGGYRAAGRTVVEARALIDQARWMQDSGAVLLLLEATTAEVSRRIVETVDVPVIGCGAGPACHGEVVVLHDLLGLTDWQPPFAPPRARMGQAIAEAAASWVQQVGGGGDPQCPHPYRMSEDERRRLDED